MRRRTLLAALLLFSAVQARADEAPPFGTPPVVTPTGPMRGMVLLFSDHGGIAEADRATAEALGKAGVLVAEIDTDAYLARLAEATEDCQFIVPDLELLSRQLQRAHPGATYHTPILAGRGLGGTLAEIGLAQAWPTTIDGAVSLDPALSIGTEKPFCGDPLAARKSLQGFWSVGFTGSTARARIEALKAAGTPVAIESATTLEALILPHLPPATEASDVADLPLIELPADKPSDLLAVVLSGDGGWRDIDMNLAENLRKSGVPVIGWDALRYFWREKTPDGTAEDLAAIMQIYMAKWQASRVALIGYSFGADVLPFAYNRLPADLRPHVALMALLGFANNADFEITMGGWLGAAPSEDALAVLPEVAKVPPGLIQCFYGSDEDDTMCPALAAKGVEQIKTTGGHHFDGDYAALAKRILAGLRKRAG